MTNQDLQFGLIGCGRIGKKHAYNIAKSGKLIAVCDIDITEAQNVATNYQAIAYTDYLEMLSKHPELDIIAVCTPNGLHAAHSIAALKSKCHVICEKPMALNTADCEAMIAASTSSGYQLFVVKQNRYNPPVVALKKLLDENRLGKVYSIQVNCFWNRSSNYYCDNWHGTLALDGGTLFTQFSHFLDLVNWLMGEVVDIKGFRANFAHPNIIEFEDTGVAILRFKNGAIGGIHYTLDSFKRNMEGSIVVFGEKGTVKIGGQYLNELEYQEIENYQIADLPEGNLANEYGVYTGSMSNHDLVYANVIDVLRNGGVMVNTNIEAMETVGLIERIYTESGMTVNNFHQPES